MDNLKTLNSKLPLVQAGQLNGQSDETRLCYCYSPNNYATQHTCSTIISSDKLRADVTNKAGQINMTDSCMRGLILQTSYSNRYGRTAH
jgi:hypothetical protein